MTAPVEPHQPLAQVELRRVLASQYHAALAMLREAIELCPDDEWTSSAHLTRTWQMAYHALFFAHLYVQQDEHSFTPWEHHQKDCQYPDGIAGPADPGSDLPLGPEPYTRAALLEYSALCDAMVDPALAAMDLSSSDSGFSWYPISKLEHQLVNIRHIQHHAAQLADRVRSAADVGVDWVGARPAGRV